MSGFTGTVLGPYKNFTINRKSIFEIRDETESYEKLHYFHLPQTFMVN